METDPLENILRRAPKPAAPVDLLSRLQNDISLPRPATNRGVIDSGLPWFRRWLPELAFACVLFLSLSVIAFQSQAVKELKQANTNLAAQVAQLEQLKTEHAQLLTNGRLHDEFERLKAAQTEIVNLRAEIARLKEEIAKIDQLRAENHQLAEQLKAANTSTNDFFAEAKDNAERIKCVNNLKQIGLAARIYATDNNDTLPATYAQFENLMGSPKIKFCPSNGETMMYNYDGNGVSESDPNYILAWCTHHGHVCRTDGSVIQGVMLNPAQYKVTNKNGHLYMGE